MGKLNGLDLFSGYGGITLALQEFIHPIAYCEIERYSMALLLSRMSEEKLPIAPIWDDIRTLKGIQFRGLVDIIYGGFPCQNISLSGDGKGLAGSKSGIFYELSRLVKEINPKFVFLENVPAVRTRGLREIVREFTNLGYDCRWTSISAKEIGSPHIRKRWFFLGNLSNSKCDRRRTNARNEKPDKIPCSKLQQKNWQAYPNDFAEICRKYRENSEWWKNEPGLDRMVDGCTFRLDRIKSLGNGVVPIQAYIAFKRLMGFV